MPLRDVDLMLRIRAGDEEAFRELMDRYAAILVRFFRRLGMSIDDAEDGAQEIFLRLYRSREEYVPKTKFRHFLFRIATNYWIDRFRAAKRRPTSLSLDLSLERDPGGGRPSALKDQLPGKDRRPDAILSNRELGDRIDEAIRRLPEGQRIVFLLGEAGGILYTEIGKMLGIPVGTVKSRMHTAVHELRRLLTKERA
jgi:RNA polymerase sigma-70 factor (ECF subfamily)